MCWHMIKDWICTFHLDILSLNESKTNDIEQILTNENEENNLQQTNMKEEYLIDSSSSGLVSLSTQLSSNILDKNKSNEVFLLK